MPTQTPVDLVGEAFRAKQHALADAAATLVINAWRNKMAGADDVRAAADSWLATSIPIIARSFRTSAQYGQAFYKAQRRLQVPDEASMAYPALPTFDEKAATSSLWVTGPLAFVEAERVVEEILSPEVITKISGAVSRHTQNGGRAAIDDAYDRDPKTVGYYRIEDGDPCWFCAMLMSRGVVYKEDSFSSSDPRFFGPGDAKVHDHCGGSLAPSYDRGNKFPGNSQDHADLWSELTGKDRNGKPIDPATEFRQRYEGRY